MNDTVELNSSSLDLFRAAPHVRLHRGRTMVIKVGGAALTRPSSLERFARQIATVEALGAQVVVVHGGGAQTDVLQRMLGDEPHMVDGRRVTTPEGLRALSMATAGELNGAIVAALAGAGAPAVGVSGASAGLLVADRRPPVPTSEGMIDFGEVGDVRAVDPAPLRALLAAGHTPVVSPPASDGAGGLLNVNAEATQFDWRHDERAAKLVLLTGAPGVLEDPSDPATLCSALTLAELDELERGGAFEGGMRVKGAACRMALEGRVERVHVVSGDDPDALLRELYTNHGAGTLITLQAETAPPASEVTLTPQSPKPDVQEVQA